MLDHILRQAQSFEYRHGIKPNIVFINKDHYQVLQQYYPELFSQDPAISLGFRIAIVSNENLCHPEVAWFPPRFSEQLGEDVEAPASGNVKEEQALAWRQVK